MEAVFQLLHAARYLDDLNDMFLVAVNLCDNHMPRSEEYNTGHKDCLWVDDQIEFAKEHVIEGANAVHGASKNQAVQRYLDHIYDHYPKNVVKIIKDALDSTFMDF